MFLNRMSVLTLGAGAAIARGCTVWMVAAEWAWWAAARGAGERARWGGAWGESPPIDMAIVLSDHWVSGVDVKEASSEIKRKGRVGNVAVNARRAGKGL